MSNLLNERHALAKLRAELEGRKGKLCRSCKGFRHLVRNCRNKKEEEKGAVVPQNKFEVLSSRVMQCEVGGKTMRSVRTMGVRCFKCREEEHKCRECPLWVKKERRLACPVRGKAQEEERKLRRVEEDKAAHPMKGKAQQEEWKRSLWEVLRKRAEWYCRPIVPQDAQLWELG